MAFRKVGGTDRLKTNNYVSNNTANMVNANITDSLGKLNTKIVSQSHLDLQGQTLFNVGNVVFVNGTDLATLVLNMQKLNDIVYANNIWTGTNTFNNTTTLNGSSYLYNTKYINGVLGEFQTLTAQTLTSTNATMGTLKVTGDIEGDSNLNISGNATIGGTLGVTGGINMNSSILSNAKATTQAAGSSGQYIATTEFVQIAILNGISNYYAISFTSTPTHLSGITFSSSSFTVIQTFNGNSNQNQFSFLMFQNAGYNPAYNPIQFSTPLSLLSPAGTTPTISSNSYFIGITNSSFTAIPFTISISSDPNTISFNSALVPSGNTKINLSGNVIITW